VLYRLSGTKVAFDPAKSYIMRPNMTTKKSSYLKQHWKVLLNIATVAALLIVVVAIHKELITTFKTLHKVDFWALFLLIPIEIWNYHAQAKLYQGLFKVVGNDLDYRLLFETSLELNFINSVFPSGGVSGISYFGARMRSDKISGGRATLVQIMKLMLIFVSFEILLVLGLFFIAIKGHVNGLTLLIGGAMSTLLIVGTFAFVLIIGDRRRINASFEFITKILNRIIHVVRPGHPETIGIDRFRPAVDELHDNYKLMEKHLGKLKWPLFHALEANFSEILAVYVVYIAFGHWVNFGAVILAYAVSNFAGLISVLPSGVGVYEAIMTAVLAATGVPPRISLPVTVMYRVLNTILQLPPGYFYYHRTLHRQTQ
jgi:uncharacterized protein (TIRG00374 family)